MCSKTYIFFNFDKAFDVALTYVENICLSKKNWYSIESYILLIYREKYRIGLVLANNVVTIVKLTILIRA